MSVAGDQLYQLIKTDESQFPIPAPYVTINVGTFNAATASFSGLTTKVDFDPEPIEHLPKQHPINPAPKYQGSEWVSITINSRWQRTITSTPAPIVPLAPILLQFSVENYASAWSVAANGITANAAAGQTSLTISVWDATIVNWGITVGESFYKDTVRIQRPAGLVDYGAGAFTIPVIPCTIVYAPPADSLGKSVASYLSGQTVGMSLTTSFDSDSSSTSPGTNNKYADAANFVSVLDIFAQTLSQFQATAVVGKVLGDISSAIGKFSSNVLTGISEQTDNQLTLTETLSTSLTTLPAAGGPGAGDLINFFKDVRVAWTIMNGQMTLFPFDYTLTSFPAAGMEKNMATLGISAEDAELLLALDPFVAGGPDAALPPDRFVFQESWEYGFGTQLNRTVSKTRDTKDIVTTKNYTTSTTEWDPGPIFQLLGFGGKSSTTLSISNATGSDVSSTVTLTATVVSGPNDHFLVSVYYDNLFGTFAFQQNTLSPTVRFQGDGATPDEQVTLVTGGKTFLTVADQKGEYSFWSPAIPSGSAMLGIGSLTPRPVTIAQM